VRLFSLAFSPTACRLFALLSILPMVCFAMVPGCATQATRNAQMEKNIAEHDVAVSHAHDGIAAAKLLGASVQREVTAAVPHADPVGQAHLTTAGETLTDQTKQLDIANAATATASESNNRLAGQLAAQVQAYETDHAARVAAEAKYHDAWAGGALVRLFWRIVAVWSIIGACAAGLLIWNPLGLGVLIGRELLALLPAANGFAWLSKLATPRAAVVNPS